MLHKKISEESKQSQSIWYDDEKDKYFLINNETGEMLCVHKTGDFIKEFDASLTGSVDYNERIQRAQKNKAYMPYQTSSLKYNEKITFYTPQSDKFLGYSQFPNPRCIPYYNDRNSTHKNVSLKDRSIIEKSYSPQNQLNSSLFKYKHNDDLGVSFLTATLLDKKKLMASGKITYLKERQMNEKMVNSLPNIAKIINNQKLHYPNENLFSTQMIKVKKSENSVHEKKLKEQKDIKLKAQFDLKINTERFTKKSQSLGHKTIIFSSNDLNHERKINDFYKTEATRFLDVGTMSKKMEGFNTKTFDGSMKLNFDLETMPLTENMKFESICIKTEKMMDRKIKRQREELEGFKMPPEKQKETVITKGRFNSLIPTPVDLANIDRNINRQVFPELYKEKDKEEKEKMSKDKNKKKKRLYIDPITKKNV